MFTLTSRDDSAVRASIRRVIEEAYKNDLSTLGLQNMVSERLGVFERHLEFLDEKYSLSDNDAARVYFGSHQPHIQDNLEILRMTCISRRSNPTTIRLAVRAMAAVETDLYSLRGTGEINGIF